MKKLKNYKRLTSLILIFTLILGNLGGALSGVFGNEEELLTEPVAISEVVDNSAETKDVEVTSEPSTEVVETKLISETTPAPQLQSLEVPVVKGKGFGNYEFTVQDTAGTLINGITMTINGTEVTIVDGTVMSPSLTTGTMVDVVIDNPNYVKFQGQFEVLAGLNTQLITLEPKSIETALNINVTNTSGNLVSEGKVSLNGNNYTSDANGNIRIEGLNAGDNFDLTVSHIDYVSATVAVTLVQGENNINVVLTPLGASVSGLVKDVDGNPIANANVLANGVAYVTDGSGIFSISDLFAGDNLNISISHPNYSQYTGTPVLAQGLNELSFELKEVGVVSGVVTGEADALLEGAVVTVNGETLNTNALGEFTSSNIEVGTEVTLVISYTGYDDKSEVFTVEKGANVKNTKLVKTTTKFKGIVKDQDGSPLSGATVTVGTDTYTTDDKGYYETGVLNVGEEYTITATHANYEDFSTLITTVSGNNPLDITLNVFTGNITGIVKDNLGNPAVGAVVTITKEVNGVPVVETLTADALGAYTSGNYNVGTTVTIATSFAGHDTKSSEVEIVKGANTLDVDLVKTLTRIAGNVSDKDGNPLAAIEVLIDGKTYTTNELGFYQSDELLDSTEYTVNVSNDKYVPYEGSVTTIAGINNHSFNLVAKQGNISGIVKNEAGDPISGAVVVFSVDVNGEKITSEVTTDDTGVYTSPNYDVGTTVSITVSAQGYEPKTSGVDVVFGTYEENYTLSLEAVKIAGFVKNQGGEPMEGVEVVVGDVPYTTDNLGYYETTVLNANTEYAVSVQKDNYDGYSGNVTTGTGKTQLDITLTILKGSVKGIVTDENDQPIAGATVSITEAGETDPKEVLTTDALGAYVSQEFDAGTVIAVVVTYEGYDSQSAGVTIALGEIVTDFKLVKTITKIEGTVGNKDGLGLEGIEVVIGDKTYTTDENGKFESDELEIGATYLVTITSNLYGTYSKEVTTVPGVNSLNIVLLHKAGFVTGKVLNAQGEPVVGLVVNAKVTLEGEEKTYSTVTNELGVYTTEEFDIRGTVVISIDDVRFNKFEENVVLVEGSNTLDINLATSDKVIGKIVGQVVDSAGAPLAGIEVLLNEVAFVTDASGAFEGPAMEVGTTATISINNPLYKPFSGSVLIKEGENKLDINLLGINEESGVLKGIVTDADGNPLKEINVTVDGVNYVTNDLGEYTSSEILLTKEVAVSVVAQGYKTFEDKVTIDNAITELNITLEVDPEKVYGFVAGIVKDEANTPLSGITVFVGGDEYTTDENGYYKSADFLVGSEVNVAIGHSSYKPYLHQVTIVKDLNTNDITLENLVNVVESVGIINGKVLDGEGNVLSDVTVTVNGDTYTTDASGLFTTKTYAYSDNVTVALAKDGYTSKTYTTEIKDSVNTFEGTLIKSTTTVTPVSTTTTTTSKSTSSTIPKTGGYTLTMITSALIAMGIASLVGTRKRKTDK